MSKLKILFCKLFHKKYASYILRVNTKTKTTINRCTKCNLMYVIDEKPYIKVEPYNYTSLLELIPKNISIEEAGSIAGWNLQTLNKTIKESFSLISTPTDNFVNKNKNCISSTWSFYKSGGINNDLLLPNNEEME